MKAIILGLVVLALMAAACGDAGDEATTITSATTTTTTSAPGTTAPPDTTAPRSESDDVLLQVRDEGGFVPFELLINRPPTYTVLRNGTFIYQGPQPGAFPGPVMSDMRQTQLSADDMKDIMVLIEAAGLPAIDEVINNDAQNFVADATTTIAVYYDENGATHTYAVYALGLTMDQELPDDLANLTLLRERLANLAFAAGEPYVSDRIVVRIIEGGTFSDIDDTRQWDFPFAPDDLDLLNDLPCGVYGGAEAEPVRTLLSDATIATQWKHESGTFAVLARDVLPGEIGCDIR